jgi:hypothetical protein
MDGQHTGNGQHTGWRPPRRFSVTVQRLARPPTPWTWAIHEDDAADPCHRSSRFYRSAEEAWAVGRAILTRLTDPIRGTRVGESRSEAGDSDPIPD